MSSYHRSAGVFLGTVLALFCAVSPARGGLTFFSTAPSYNAATTGNTAVNFTGIASANNFVQENVPPGLTVGGVNSTIDTTKSNGSLFVVDAGFSNNFFHVTILDSQFSSTTNDNILITLPHAVTAAAFDFGSNNGSTVTFALSTGDTFTRSTTAQSIQFVGLTSTLPFTTVEFSQPTGGGLVLQDLVFGTAVPEPGSITLVATSGLVLLGYGLRRRRTAAQVRAQG
jgi:hypothetical protein